MKKLNSTIKGLLLSLFTIGATFFVLEIAYRAYKNISGKIFYYRSDTVLGWAPQENAFAKRSAETLGGEQYTIHYSTDSAGFRFSEQDWDSPDPSGPSILVIGDSYTGDPYTSDREAWFYYLHREFNSRLFAYGIGGSGSLQQALALEKIAPLINPEILIIQYCGNDTTSSSLKNEQNGVYLSQSLRRPYLRDDSQVIYNSGIFPKIYRYAYNNSKLFGRIDLAIQKIRLNFLRENTSKEVAKNEALIEHKLIAEWEKQWNYLIRVAKENNISKIWTASCDSGTNFHNAWFEASLRTGVTLLLEMSSSIKHAKQQGLDLHTKLWGHWNPLGNKIVGMALVKEIKERNLLK